MGKTVCDTCIDALDGNFPSFGNLLKKRWNVPIADYAVELGYLMPDHLCDSIEVNGDIFANAAGKVLYHCACSGH